MVAVMLDLAVCYQPKIPVTLMERRLNEANSTKEKELSRLVAQVQELARVKETETSKLDEKFRSLLSPRETLSSAAQEQVDPTQATCYR
jgi:hypothetical protein